MMQRNENRDGSGSGGDPACAAGPIVGASGGCYGVQVLIAGRRKPWRDEVSAQIRRAGYNATTVESAVDALTVLVLGLPVDVLVTDAELSGSLGCGQLAAEARALRPNLDIVLACAESGLESVEAFPSDAIRLAGAFGEGAVATTVREALAARAA